MFFSCSILCLVSNWQFWNVCFPVVSFTVSACVIILVKTNTISLPLFSSCRVFSCRNDCISIVYPETLVKITEHILNFYHIIDLIFNLKKKTKQSTTYLDTQAADWDTNTWRGFYFVQLLLHRAVNNVNSKDEINNFTSVVNLSYSIYIIYYFRININKTIDQYLHYLQLQKINYILFL